MEWPARAEAGHRPGKRASTEEALRVIRGLDVLSGVDPALVDGLAAEHRWLDLDDGAVLASGGDAADEIYVIVGGLLAVSTPAGDGGGLIAEVGPGAVVGEVAVLAGGRRSADLRAIVPSRVLGLSAATFAALVEAAPVVARGLAAQARRRMDTGRLLAHLRHLFPDTDDAGRKALVDAVEWTYLEPGDVLFGEGDVADAAYVVVSGRVRVLAEAGGRLEPVGEVGRGELVGEMALLLDDPRSATVVAARETALARIPRDAFDVFVLTDPRTMLALSRTIVGRNRDGMDAHRRARSDRLSIALLALHPNQDIGHLVATIATCLARHGSVTPLTAEHVEGVLGVEGIADAGAGTVDELRLDRWLYEQEDRSRFTLLVSSGAMSPWSRRCVARADHLVLVAAAASHPAVTETERRLVAERALPHQRISLLLVHEPDVDRPSGTAAWLEPRDVDDHHHVRRGHEADIARFARQLAGRAVGLVLSGGGAKGFAHLGVMRALEEQGIPIDIVGGASMGAPLGAILAMESPPEDRVDLTEAYYRRILDYTVPVASVVAGRRVVRNLGVGAGGRAIEDLWLPFFCVSANLTTARLVVHRRGDLATAMRASLSIPGVLPPVPVGEDLLVDGGVLNNVPVDVMRRINPTGTVIVSDVAPPRGPRAASDYGQYVSGARVMARRLLPGMKPSPVPLLGATLMRSMLVAAAQHRERQITEGLADLYLEFDLWDVGLLDFGATRRVAERGYVEACPQVESWLAEAGVPS